MFWHVLTCSDFFYSLFYKFFITFILFLWSSCFYDHFFFGSFFFIPSLYLFGYSTGACDKNDDDGGPAGGCIACKTCLKGQYQNQAAATACIKCDAGRFTDLRAGKSAAVCGKVLCLQYLNFFIILYYINYKGLTFLFFSSYITYYTQAFALMVHLWKLKELEHVTCAQLDIIPQVLLLPITTIVHLV